MPVIFKRLLVILYLLAIILYIGQGLLYEGTWYSKLAGAYLLLFNMTCVVKVFAKRQIMTIFSVLILFLIWNIFLWGVSTKTYRLHMEVVFTSSMLLHIIFVCSSFFSFYVIGNQRILKLYHLVFFILSLNILFVYNVLHYDVTTLGAGEYNFSSANNMAYYLVALFPFYLVFWGKKILMLILMISSFVFIIFCLKRGAMICAGLFILATIFMIRKQNSTNKAIIRNLLILLIPVVLGYVFMSIYNDNELLQGRFDHGSDARNEIYNKILYGLESSSILEILVGHGPMSTLAVAGNFAHNDWLEIFYDFGLIGLVLYVFVPISIFIYYRKSQLTAQEKTVFMFFLLYVLVRSTISMCIYELESLLVFGYLGMTMGEYHHKLLFNRKGYSNEKY